MMLVLWLDVLRRAWGGPIKVNSGFRCGAHNREVGGSPMSRHLIGCAADIAPVGADGTERARFLALARGLGSLPGWEAIVYSTFAHVAVPRAEADAPWNGGPIDIALRPMPTCQDAPCVITCPAS